MLFAAVASARTVLQPSWEAERATFPHLLHKENGWRNLSPLYIRMSPQPIFTWSMGTQHSLCTRSRDQRRGGAPPRHSRPVVHIHGDVALPLLLSRPVNGARHVIEATQNRCGVQPGMVRGAAWSRSLSLRLMRTPFSDSESESDDTVRL